MENATKGYVYQEEIIKKILSTFDVLDRITGRDKYKAITSIIEMLETPVGEIEIKQNKEEENIETTT